MIQSLNEYLNTVTQLFTTIEMTDGQGLKLSKNKGGEKAINMILSVVENAAKVILKEVCN